MPYPKLDLHKGRSSSSTLAKQSKNIPCPFDVRHNPFQRYICSGCCLVNMLLVLLLTELPVHYHSLVFDDITSFTVFSDKDRLRFFLAICSFVRLLVLLSDAFFLEATVPMSVRFHDKGAETEVGVLVICSPHQPC